MVLLRNLTLLLGLLSMGGCSDHNFNDLDAFMSEVKARPGKPIAAIPEFKPYETFIYSAQALRQPFEKPVEISEMMRRRGASKNIKPDLTREKEFLEGFAIDDLQMVGSLAREGGYWVLMLDPEGGVHRVTIGNYMGNNYGRVIEVGDSHVTVMEIVSDGIDGWLERPKTINIDDAEEE